MVHFASRFEDADQCGREDMMAEAGGGWSHGNHSQEAEMDAGAQPRTPARGMVRPMF